MVRPKSRTLFLWCHPERSEGIFESEIGYMLNVGCVVQFDCKSSSLPLRVTQLDQLFWEIRGHEFQFVLYLHNQWAKRNSLYSGVTNDLERRVLEHKRKLIKGYSKKFNLGRLLYYEEFNHPLDAIEAEKRIKGWLRVKKLNLIRTINPKFKDLSEDWGE
ncbi:MAG: GIY-YIG nuclease family protein [Anaerolineales bacterium]